MTREQDSAVEFPKYSDEWYVDLYFRHGSVEEVLKAHDFSLPISVAQYHRKVKQFGVIKSAGRHSSLTEALYFFAQKALEPNIPLEKLYYSRMPLSFRTSIQSLHRVYRNTEQRIIQRQATALVLSPEGDNEQILVGDEKTENIKFGKKKGDTSVLMSFSGKNESNYQSVLRVLQQEFSTDLVRSGELKVNGSLASEIIPEDAQPFMYLDIMDVRVSVYHLELPHILCSLGECSSYKLGNHRFLHISDFEDRVIQFRQGMKEIAAGYANYLQRDPNFVPDIQLSFLNQQILAYQEV